MEDAAVLAAAVAAAWSEDAKDTSPFTAATAAAAVAVEFNRRRLRDAHALAALDRRM